MSSSFSRFVVAICLVAGALAATPAEARIRAETVNAYDVSYTAEGNVVSAVCCGTRCVAYRHHVRRRCCDPCLVTVPVVLHVKDPCTCCVIEIPVCIPSCCSAAPTACCHKGHLGKNVVTYSWDCGYCLDVVFDRRGDVTVHYYGW